MAVESVGPNAELDPAGPGSVKPVPGGFGAFGSGVTGGVPNAELAPEPLIPSGLSVFGAVGMKGSTLPPVFGGVVPSAGFASGESPGDPSVGLASGFVPDGFVPEGVAPELSASEPAPALPPLPEEPLPPVFCATARPPQHNPARQRDIHFRLEIMTRPDGRIWMKLRALTGTERIGLPDAPGSRNCLFSDPQCAAEKERVKGIEPS